MNLQFILSHAMVLFMLMDPFGNLPLFVSLLHKQTQARYRHIVLRECLFALILMCLALFIGRRFLEMMDLSTGVLRLSGGLILLLMGLKMVFSSISPEPAKNTADGKEEKEPYIVPLAIPLICGPGTLAMLLGFLHSTPEATVLNSILGIALAWLVQGVILFFGMSIASAMGNKLLDALESLMGLLLATLAISMLITGIHEIYGIPETL